MPCTVPATTLLQHLLLGAQLAVAVNLDLHMAVGGLATSAAKLLHGNKAGVAFGLCMTHGHGEVAQRCKLVLTGCCGTCCSAGGCCAGSSRSGCTGNPPQAARATCSCHCTRHLQEIATRDLFIIFLLVSGVPLPYTLAKFLAAPYTAFSYCTLIVTENSHPHKSQTSPTFVKFLLCITNNLIRFSWKLLQSGDTIWFIFI